MITNAIAAITPLGPMIVDRAEMVPTQSGGAMLVIRLFGPSGRFVAALDDHGGLAFLPLPTLEAEAPEFTRMTLEDPDEFR